MKTVRNKHDLFFKAAMADLRVAKDFLQTYLPANAQTAIDLDTLVLQPNSYVDQSLKTVMSDVLYQAQLKDRAGETAYIYLLTEHQSTNDPLMAFRIWRYVINIWADILKQSTDTNESRRLPLIIPLVFYTGETAFKGSNDIRDLIQAPADLINETLFQQTFQLIDINAMSDETLQKSQWAGMMALMMKHIKDRDILVFLKEIIGTLKQLEQANGTDFILVLLQYCLNTGETLNIKGFVQTVRQGLSHEIGEKIMTIAEQLIAQGEAKGRIQGEMDTLHSIAIKAFNKKLSINEIQELTGLSLENLISIKDKISH